MSDSTNQGDEEGTAEPIPEYDQPTIDSTVEKAQSELPRKLGRYLLESRLGQGGMGTVYLATDTVLKRRVALKVPRFEGSNREILLRRFIREARTMAAISHEHLCTIHDVDEIDGVHCLVMEFVDGQTLSDRSKTETVIPQQRAALLGAKLAQALQLAHDAGVVHRDLKPSNILLRKSGEPVITDFGLARNLFSNQSSEEASSQRALTVTGDLLGSPKYMSPEQVEADHRQVGPATDIYSLGVLLYQLVAGRAPFEGSMARVLHSIATEDPPSPRLYNPKIDSRLEMILAVALAKSPKDRYASAAEFAIALDTFAQLPEESLGKKPGSVGNRIVLALTTTIVLAGLAAFALPRNDVSDSGDSKPGEATAGITDFRGNQSNDAEAHTDPVESESIEQSDLLRAFSSADGMIHGDFAICPLMSFEKFLLVIHPLRKAGYVPVDIRPFANHDILKVAMVWRQGEDDWHLEPQLTLEEFKKEDRRQTEAGRTIKSFVCFQPELDQRSSPVATWRFCAVWKTSDIPTRWRYHERVSPPADQHDEKDPIFAEGWRPVVMNGFVQRPTMAGLCQIWERNVPGWAFIRPTSTDVSSEDEQRVLGREVSSIFLGTWPPDILLFERWREIPGIESAVCCGESAADHLELLQNQVGLRFQSAQLQLSVPARQRSDRSGTESHPRRTSRRCATVLR